MLPALAAWVLSWAGALPAVAHGDLHDRIVALTVRLQTNAANGELWLQRADLRRQHGEWEAALEDVESAGRLKPDWLPARLQRARIFHDQEKSAETVRAATYCLVLDPANADALVLRARSLARLGKFEAAVADYDAVLADAGGPRPLPDLFLERARCLAALGKHERAVRGLDEGLRQLGETPSLALPAIDYERDRGAFAAALDRLERARKYFDRESHLVLRGEIFLQAGRTAEAEKDFRAALDLLEHPPSPRRNRPPIAPLVARARSGLARLEGAVPATRR